MNAAGVGDIGPAGPSLMEMSNRRFAAFVIAGALLVNWAIQNNSEPTGSSSSLGIERTNVQPGAGNEAKAPNIPVLPCTEWLQAPDLQKKAATTIRAVAQREIVGKKKAPGATIAIGCGDQLIATVAVGKTGSTSPISPATTRYDLASVTKHFTAATVLKLADQGKLKLNDPISKFLPQYRTAQGGKSKVTFQMLLQHRSGIVDPSNYSPLLSGNPSTAKLLGRLLTYPVARKPGAAYSYSNIGYDVLYAAASKAAGEPLDVFEQRELFKPLGMNHTGYLPKDRQCAPTSPDANGNASALSRVLTCVPQDRLSKALGGKAGHAGLFSTAEDMARFFGAEANNGFYGDKQVISNAALKAMHTPAVPRPRPLTSGQTPPYGAGTRFNPAYASGNGRSERILSDKMSTSAAGHTGWAGPIALADPTTGLYSVVLSNPTLHKSISDDQMYGAYKKITDAAIDVVQP